MPDTAHTTGFDQDAFYDSVLQEKYCKHDERTREEIFRRVARGLAAIERTQAEAADEARLKMAARGLGAAEATPEAIEQAAYERFLSAQQAGFYPAGRVASACGTDIRATLINCFVQPVGDSISEDRDGKPGIYRALGEAAETMRRGGGVGYDFSLIRPRGAKVASTQSRASGPISYMRVFDRSCETVESAGARRGAQMGIMRCDHPDIEDFVTAKDLREFNALLAQIDLDSAEAEALRNRVRTLSNFNLSVAVTDELMAAVADGRDFELVHAAEPSESLKAEGAYQRDDGMWVYRRLPARDLWDRITRQTYETAEPGVVFIDRMNADNNLGYCERIEATNPCVTADTRLHTRQGLVRIGDLHAQGESLEVSVDTRALGGDKRGTAARTAAPAFLTSESADVYKVVTADGYEIKATRWHDFYTARGKLPLSELKMGDEVLVQSGKGLFGSEGNEHLGRLLGFITGDGHFTNRGGGEEAVVLSFWNEERQLAEQICHYVNSLIGDLAKTRRIYRVQPVAVPERQMLFVRSVLLARVLQHYGFTRDSKLSVPEVIWRGSEACVRAYLQALFQADGTVNVSCSRQSCSVRLASSSRELLRDIQQLLANFGVFCRIRARRAAGKRTLPDGNGGARAYSCQADFELIIDGESRETFMQEIGFLLDRKNARYREWVADKKLRKTQRFASPVAEISYVGKEPVFDTTQPDHNAVIFNGLVTGQCGEQPLPDYGCCCLGSVDLAAFVREPFGDVPVVDWEALGTTVETAVRMLDDVLDATYWPLPQQRDEAMHKRRVGLGMTGLGTATAMMERVYGADDGVALAEELADFIKRRAYQASVALAREKGAFPAFSADDYLASGFMQRMPEDIRASVAAHGIRNSHLLSIAPTGTISLAFGRNISNGVEPPFAWAYSRVKRQADGTRQSYEVQDRGYRLYIEQGGDPEALPEYFVNAQTLPVAAHLATQAAVQRHVDSSISKTINVPADYDFEAFKQVYADAFAAGCKGCTTYRPNDSTGAVLSVTPTGKQTPASFVEDSDRRIRLDQVPAPALASLRWPGRPEMAEGNPSWTYFVDGDTARFAVVIGHTDNGATRPFEVWVNGTEQPPGLSAIAKLLSMDMRSQDRGWLAKKLDALVKTRGAPIRAVMPGQGEVTMASATAVLARLVKLRCEQLGAFDEDGATPVLDALMSDKEPKADTDGTMSWTVDIANAQTSDDFVLGLKELVMPDGNRRPYSVWLSGDYPRDLDGLCKLLSLDMRVIDPAWIGEKLRKLLSYAEPHGDFLARVPGGKRMQRYPSTMAYMGALMLHRYRMLGILDSDGASLHPMGVLAGRDARNSLPRSAPLPGAPCPDCGAQAVVRRDGCDACTACGWVGACG
ncbi:LAGLIDADG family homing endonuclease [Algiphilus aromaticivorans]|uniref:LAGLIDADG family homing endonuclease n=1 Tax=Algiphilus aromaticivorans TaxID=382454 RepID=UPI0006938324|nr:LAGLIDADG family homing endonuclease [Algiphilus aromaticivorans]